MWLSGIAVCGALLVTASPSSADGRAARCSEQSYPVQLAQGERTLRGTLCRPARDRRPVATLLLVHGSTYDRVYWDLPIKPARYSFLRRSAAAGYVTVAIDKLGSGESDRPPAADVTPEASASALSQVISALRAGVATTTTSQMVFAVGHSSGSTLILREAAQHDDVDGLVVTGFLHNAGPGASFYASLLHPAAEDPAFRDDPTLPLGYVTTRPGMRSVFYYGFNAEERVLDADEATKDVLPGGDVSVVDERNTGFFAAQIDTPVLAVVGGRDSAFCSPPSCPEAGREAAFYPASASVRVVVQPQTGHNLNLHRSAPCTSDLILGWVAQRVGRNDPRTRCVQRRGGVRAR